MTAIRKVKLSDQLYEQLLALIIKGEFAEGDQLPSEMDLALRFSLSRPVVREALARLREERVRIPAAAKRVFDYPHQFSGRMRQRVMIAMAIALEPEILIADEPTTALDVTVQRQILELIGELQAASGMALILISHDLGVIAERAREVVVMYAGRVVERGPCAEVLSRPAHPYTRGLLDSRPSPLRKGLRLVPIQGNPPRPGALPEGCAFHPRCPMADEHCRAERPALRPVEAGRAAACHHSERLLAREGAPA